MLFFDFSFATRTITDDISDHYFRQKAIKMSCCSLCTFSACRLLPCPADDCDQQFCCQDHLKRFFLFSLVLKTYRWSLLPSHVSWQPLFELYLVQTQRQKWHLPIVHSAFGPCRWKVEYKWFFLSLWFLPIMWLWINNSLHVPISHCYVLIKKNIYIFTIEFVTFNQVPCC